MCGVYPAKDALTAGDEISSTYEGRHVTLREDELIHLTTPAGFVAKGDPVIFCLAGVAATHGWGVGVSFMTGTATDDLIAVDTEGIWNLEVIAYDDAAGSAVVPGDPLYINTNDCVISKRRNLVTQIPFGYALGNLDSTAEGTIAVKVHWDPEEQQDEFILWVAGDGAGAGKCFNITDGSDIAGGYVTGLRVNYELSGAKTGGYIRAIHVDMETSDSPTVWDLDGYSLYQDALGTAVVSHLTGINLGMNNTDAVLSTSQFIRVYNHGLGTMDAVIRLANTGGVPITNLLNFGQAVAPLHGGSLDDSATADILCDAYITCEVGGIPYYLALYDTTA